MTPIRAFLLGSLLLLSATPVFATSPSFRRTSDEPLEGLGAEAGSYGLDVARVGPLTFAVWVDATVSPPRVAFGRSIASGPFERLAHVSPLADDATDVTSRIGRPSLLVEPARLVASYGCDDAMASDFVGVCISTSSDLGASWSFLGRVIDQTQAPTFAKHQMAHTDLFRHAGTYQLLVGGQDSQFGTHSVGLASSDDLESWTWRSPSAVLAPGIAPFASRFVYSTDTRTDGETLVTVFYAQSGETGSIGLATSDDGGLRWTASPSPILAPALTWEGGALAYPSLVAFGCRGEAYYQGQGGFGRAVGEWCE